MLHRYHASTNLLEVQAELTEGHTSTVGAITIPQNDTNIMASGDWDGGVCIWKITPTSDTEPTKRRKSSQSTKVVTATNCKPVTTMPDAHGGQISGAAWKQDSLVTGSWDHSIKVWNVERQDCLLSLNGSRVVSCLALSSHSSDVVATGHPDCTVRLWDVRTDGAQETSLVSDSSLKPSHKAWVSGVQWSPINPYLLASTSYDGTLKLWDIRSSVPLHTVRTQAKGQKNLCLAYGDQVIYTGGTDCIVKQYLS